MHTWPKILIAVGATAGLAVALTSLAQTHRLDMLVECCDRLATFAVVALVIWLTATTRALARQNAALAEQQAELGERVAAQADRSNLLGREFAREIGNLHTDRREDEQHYIAVMAALKALGPRLDGRLVAVAEQAHAEGYAQALDGLPPAPPTHLRLVP